VWWEFGTVGRGNQEVRWDVVGLAETWLDAENEKGVGMEGYEVVCASCKDKRGGGVAVFIRE
jgi:exonuclease III